ncbi:UDP-N-acetylmuramyl pentapeptide phosphotransferase/UDP-N-acetylglucosamine-1-phosphate transferase [Cereibacter changlensis]|uniref:UDP-N-acetylmuramyl pentapeptide phosphotransferase/UDP-N-acetylglucosamine-1-phosphate transferase n=2 Tax=Cereibacter changlensis TaxID=402884 RepID=A0A2W7QZW9_9RHOB|nr:glycosyltransferase [Cereibacter changlensis]PZX49227.1 UDP-N-acetylmuramyl pentapeptide phosphotransferase/UDP-N-acetylglucosamine-1-phosphate transferase [Cereibacter changlensis]
MFLVPGLIGVVASLAAALLLVATQRFHGHLSLDDQAGVQKLHLTPTPRIGGVALLVGAVTGGFWLPVEAQSLWWTLCLAAMPAFASGLAEDVTKRVGVKWRLLATIFAGFLFCELTGYRIDSVDIPGADWLLSFPLFSMLFTAVAIGGIANAVNIIDGVNGLASGTAIIVLSGFAVVAGQVGDVALLGCILLAISALFGFFLMNFPVGRIFLGDAGAYSAGFVLAVIAVALPARNPELSPLIGLLALAYPVVETMVSIIRRMSREGTNPGQPDRLHLHSLVYRSRARRLAQQLGVPHMRNPMTSLILWSLSLLSSALMVLSSHSSALVLLGLAGVAAFYLVAYRRVALLGPLFDRRSPEATSGA